MGSYFSWEPSDNKPVFYPFLLSYSVRKGKFAAWHLAELFQFWKLTV